VKKYSVVLGFLALALFFGFTRGQEDTMSSATDETWYIGPTGIEADDHRMPLSVPPNPRRRFRADPILADRANSWISWVTVFPARGSRHGIAAVCTLSMDWVVERQGRTEYVPAVCQRWIPSENVWGGWFPFNDRAWYTLGMIGKEDFSVEARLINGAVEYAAIIDVSKYSRHPAAGHIWFKRWPRDVAPSGTVAVRMSGSFIIEGDAMVHIGMDRYQSEREKDQPDQEVLVSDTYTSQHCPDRQPITISMQTSRIQWQGRAGRR
jgi:hypothetical protein